MSQSSSPFKTQPIPGRIPGVESLLYARTSHAPGRSALVPDVEDTTPNEMLMPPEMHRLVDDLVDSETLETYPAISNPHQRPAGSTYQEPYVYVSQEIPRLEPALRVPQWLQHLEEARVQGNPGMLSALRPGYTETPLPRPRGVAYGHPSGYRLPAGRVTFNGGLRPARAGQCDDVPSAQSNIGALPQSEVSLGQRQNDICPYGTKDQCPSGKKCQLFHRSPPCRYFWKSEGCRFGDQCAFSHISS